MELKDYYKVLGVERSAPDANIKKAFCRLDCKHHPDVSKAPQAQAQARMQELNEANEVLRDVEKYSAYDQVGQRAQSGQDFQPLPGWNSGFEFNGPPGVFGDFGASGDHKAFFEALFSSAVVRPAQVATHDPASSHPCEEKIITPRSSRQDHRAIGGYL